MDELSIEDFNELPDELARQRLVDCCSSVCWIDEVLTGRPYTSLDALLTGSDRAVSALTNADLREALAGHPRIGDRRLVGDGSGAQVGQSAGPQSAAVGMAAGQGVAQPAGPAGVLADAHTAGVREHGTSWSRQEQVGVSTADESTLREFDEGNAEYERRFGHIYLVCASGRSAWELLAFLRVRLGNDPETEWGVVAAELAKINRIRLRKLIGGPA